MKAATTVFFLQVTASSASLFDTILPTERGTITSDPAECATRSFESYFDVPKPTGELETAFIDYGSELNKGCKSTFIDVMGRSTCTYPPRSKVCSFTEFTPSTLLSEYWSFGSVASSWWFEHSSRAVQDAAYCPNQWFDAMRAVPYGEVWLNDTIAIAGCYVAACATGHSPSTQTPTATSGLGVSETGIQATIPAGEANGAGQDRNVEIWMGAAVVLAVTSINSLLW